MSVRKGCGLLRGGGAYIYRHSEKGRRQLSRRGVVGSEVGVVISQRGSWSVHGLATPFGATVARYLGLLQRELVVVSQLFTRDYPTGEEL